MGCAHSHSGQDRIIADMGPQEIWSKLKRLKLQVTIVLKMFRQKLMYRHY
ncbi:hypothetical protein PVAP13_9KG643750 [Panicum virgatum]|uniref:Uncharacterized protein n=1 Tax=Panicum virgatum TaxID=38727 RepID=A0A8T0NXM3_PANVG|nr:hypothetical protein PVAP13_9KG643750 [Panicum virgatum]